MWRRKLDPKARQFLESTADCTTDISLHINESEKDPDLKVMQAGFHLYYRIDDILVGFVHKMDLKKLAELPCVDEVHLSVPLYAD